MTTYKLFMTACAAMGVAVLLGTVSGCEDSTPQSNLLVNPDAARFTDKMPSTLDDPIPADTVAPADSTPQFDGVCVEDTEPVEPNGEIEPGDPVPAPCAAMEFHEKFPSYSKKYRGKHIKTRVNYSNYDVGGGKIMRHVKIWPFESTWTWL